MVFITGESEMSEVTITVSGPVGSGKSAIAGEIEIAMKAIGVAVRYADPDGAESEKRMTHADWQQALEAYNPSVVIVEAITR
jgi:adenylylsulfate kinase-like enzyme